MAFRHGKDSEFSLNSVDLSAFITNTELERNVDSHDVTTYGNQSHRKFGGLFDGTTGIEGIYDDGTTGPNATIEPLIGTIVSFSWRPEGTGAGLPEVTGNVLVQAYVETSPVADMITWSAALERDGDWTQTDQI